MALIDKCMAVVAIDFGTTYSGFAYSFNNKTTSGLPRGIFVNKPADSLTHKIPTCLLLDRYQQFDSFGYRATEKYMSMSIYDQNSSYYFDRFNMELHHQKDVNEHSRVQARNGTYCLALDIFAHSIKYFVDEAIKSLTDTTGRRFSKADIHWVLTVPTIWTPRSKLFMRKAFNKADVISGSGEDCLTIALEPEAALLDCIEKYKPAHPGNTCMVVDCGSGTVDITIHGVRPSGNILEKTAQSGELLGGVAVDMEFEKLIVFLFGEHVTNKVKTSYPADWVKILNTFKMQKRSVSDKTYIRLPRSFPMELAARARSRYSTEEVDFSTDDVILSERLIYKLFEPVISKIVSKIGTLWSENVETMFLVGGFAECTQLQDEIKKKFCYKCRIAVPEGARLCVVRGAVMFGLLHQE